MHSVTRYPVCPEATQRTFSGDAGPSAAGNSSSGPRRLVRSWQFDAPSDHAKHPAWHSPMQWMLLVAFALDTEEGERARKKEVSRQKILAVAHVEARSADYATGRSVTTSNATVARRAGISVRQVERARAWLRAMGLQVVLVAGRHLNRAERRAARAAHGGNQIAAASHRALVAPKRWVLAAARFFTDDGTGDLPSNAASSLTRHLFKRVTKRADARRSAATRPPAKKKRRSAPPKPRDLASQRFAAQLQRRLGWLDLCKDRHIGHLCDLLERRNITPEHWTVDALVTHLNQWIADNGWRLPQAAHSPLAVLGTLLDRAVTADTITPAQRAAERKENIVARHRERAAEEARRAAEAPSAEALAAFRAAFR